jgi:hypothetical protein
LNKLSRDANKKCGPQKLFVTNIFTNSEATYIYGSCENKNDGENRCQFNIFKVAEIHAEPVISFSFLLTYVALGSDRNFVPK